MTMSASQIRTTIESLDLVTDQDPPERWEESCETLLREFLKGHDLRRILLPLGPVIALAAYLSFEVRALDERGLILIAIAAVATAAYAFAPIPPTISLAGVIVMSIALGLYQFAHLQLYWLLAIAIALLAHFIISRIYPALQFEHRIRAVLAYFGYPISDFSRSRLSPDDPS